VVDKFIRSKVRDSTLGRLSLDTEEGESESEAEKERNKWWEERMKSECAGSIRDENCRIYHCINNVCKTLSSIKRLFSTWLVEGTQTADSRDVK
jgi:hypothetical protein